MLLAVNVQRAVLVLTWAAAAAAVAAVCAVRVVWPTVLCGHVSVSTRGSSPLSTTLSGSSSSIGVSSSCHHYHPLWVLRGWLWFPCLAA
jgi:hypothetical protein